MPLTTTHIEPTFTLFSPEDREIATGLTLLEAAIRILKFNGQMYSIDTSAIDGVSTLLLKPAGKDWEITQITSYKKTNQECRDEILEKVVFDSPFMLKWAYAINEQE
jgi:hypothetical protein